MFGHVAMVLRFLAAIIFGVFEYGWYITEISAHSSSPGVAAGFWRSRDQPDLEGIVKRAKDICLAL